MKRVLINLFSFVIILFFGSCEPHSSPLTPDTRLTTEKIQIELVDFSRVRVSTDGEIEFSGHPFDSVQLVWVDSLGRHPVVGVRPTEASDAHLNRISFSFEALFPGSIREAFLSGELFSDSNVIATKDSTVGFYQFPYRETKLVATLDQLFGSSANNNIEDLWVDKNKLYYHLSGHVGIGELDLETRSSKELLPILFPGDNLAGGRGYLFHDLYHTDLLRYNLDSNKVDLSVPILTTTMSDAIAGLEVAGDTLYTFVWENSHAALKRFTLNCNLIDSIPFQYRSPHMTIHEGIMFGGSGGKPPQLYRYDLSAKTYLTSVVSPCRSIHGFKVTGDLIYYYDYDKRMVGVVPLSALRPVTNKRGRDTTQTTIARMHKSN